MLLCPACTQDWTIERIGKAGIVLERLLGLLPSVSIDQKVPKGLADRKTRRDCRIC